MTRPPGSPPPSLELWTSSTVTWRRRRGHRDPIRVHVWWLLDTAGVCVGRGVARRTDEAHDDAVRYATALGATITEEH